uniref:CCHC-type domain-containing protein n=1 Tax=Tanacetum cinerariifolium TaxID=118510 RepID=A0A6L2M471_TANCI|nr:hypothetical protein [Tanacetum cinerariifolium]
MSFLSVVFTPHYPSTNNQLRSTSNPRNQATLQDGRVTVQQVQGRQGQNVVGSGSQENASSKRGDTSSQVKVIKCYNCQGEWHMARQCTHPNRRRDATGFKEKLSKMMIYDSDCDDISSIKAVLMANLSSCDSNVFSEDKANNKSKVVNESLTVELEIYKERVKILEQRFNVDLSGHEKFIYSQMDDMIRMKNTKFAAFKTKIDTLKQALSKHVAFGHCRDALSVVIYILDYHSLEAPPSPDYVPGSEHPPSPVYVPEFVPEPVYLEFMPAEDDILPAEEELLPAAASPTTKSPSYIDESDPDEDPKEDPADYPADGGDEGDDEDESSDDDDIDIKGDEEEDESSDDDEDDDINIKRDEEEDEYLAPADSTAVTLPAVDHAPSAEETKPFETDESAATPPPHPTYRVIARMSIRPQTTISLPLDTKIARLMAILTPLPSPLSLLSSQLPHIPSPPLPLLSPPPTDPTYEEAALGYRAARLRWMAEREEIPKADLPLRKRLCTAHTGTYEPGESSAAAAARLREPVRDDLYRGETDDQALQRARVNMLFKDMRYHAHTASLMEGEAKASRMAWAQLMDASDAAHSGVIALCTRVSAHQTEITNLWAADRRFQTTVKTQQEEIRELQAADCKLHAQFIQALNALKSCQTQLTIALGSIQILEAAKVLAQPEVPEETGSSSWIWS